MTWKPFSTKTYTHDRGLSCAFRQWRATDSHCRFIHGYSLQVELEFRARFLDDRNWVVDFGSLKPVKDWLEANFDHRLLVAADDPEINLFLAMQRNGIADVRICEHGVGCEKFSHEIRIFVESWLDSLKPQSLGISERYNFPALHKIVVREHGSNSAGWIQT